MKASVSAVAEAWLSLAGGLPTDDGRVDKHLRQRQMMELDAYRNRIVREGERR